MCVILQQVGKKSLEYRSGTGFYLLDKAALSMLIFALLFSSRGWLQLAACFLGDLMEQDCDRHRLQETGQTQRQTVNL